MQMMSLNNISPKHSGGSSDKILNVDQTSLFSLFLKLKIFDEIGFFFHLR